jgi:hypothetical protein
MLHARFDWACSWMVLLNTSYPLENSLHTFHGKMSFILFKCEKGLNVEKKNGEPMNVRIQEHLYAVERVTLQRENCIVKGYSFSLFLQRVTYTYNHRQTYLVKKG